MENRKHVNKILSSINHFDLFLRNGWKHESEKTANNDYESSFYSLNITIDFITTVTAEFLSDWRGLSHCGYLGIVALTANYEFKEDLLFEELEDIMAALDHAENNLLNNGIPFVKSYEFHGKNKKQKALMNQRIRKRMHIEEIEAEAEKIRSREEEKKLNKMIKEVKENDKN